MRNTGLEAAQAEIKNAGRNINNLRYEDDTTLMAAAAAAKSLQSCPTLCDPIDGSPPGSPVPGILQARTLEWVAIAFSNEYVMHSDIFYTILFCFLFFPNCSFVSL